MIHQQIQGFPLFGILCRCGLLYSGKEICSVMKADTNSAGRVIGRILELSADAQIARRQTVKDSPEFHHLTGAIAAYGQALALLTAAHPWEEFYAMLAGQSWAESVSAETH
jgi:hypothetical protein